MGVLREIEEFGPVSIFVDKEGDLRPTIAWALLGTVAVSYGYTMGMVFFNWPPPFEDQPSHPLRESLNKADHQLGELLSKSNIMAYGIVADRSNNNFSFKLNNQKRVEQCSGTYTTNPTHTSITGLGHISCNYVPEKRPSTA